MNRLAVAFVVIAFARPAFAQHFTKQMPRAHDVAYNQLAFEDGGLGVSFFPRVADGQGDTMPAPEDANVSLLVLRGLARGYAELGRAPAADPAALDAFVELARGHLALGVIDITQLGFEPLAQDHRFDYGVSAADDRIAITALL